MSLTFTIELVGASKGAAAVVAGEEWNLALRLRSIGDVIHVDGAHDALLDEADWNAPTWAMDPARLVDLDRLLKTSYLVSRNGIRVSAVWANGEPKATETVTLSALLELIATSRLATQTRYVVEKEELNHGPD